MKQLKQYLQSVWYNIRHNKLYALFCITGTALTFIFVALVLQLLHILISNYPPMSNADSIVRIPSYFQDVKGTSTDNIGESETNAFRELLKDFEHVSISHDQSIRIFSNDISYHTYTSFANADFWRLYNFEFLHGRSFSEEDCMNRKNVIVISESLSHTMFKTKNSIGEKVFFQNNEYKVAGVVKDVSLLALPTQMPCDAYVPYVFNKWIPDGSYQYTIDLLAPTGMKMNEVKEKIAQAVQHHFEKKNKQVDFTPQKIQTLKEQQLSEKSDAMFKYGGISALFLFLLIPAINIFSITIANTNNQAEEIAVRRTFGASCFSSFTRMVTENLLLTFAGAFVGMALAIPTQDWIQQIIYADSIVQSTLIAHVDYSVVLLGVLPAVIVFSLLSSGLPAWYISKCNIAQVLKGGVK
ncbi:MAG: ABC transporter permease [Prevotellaceae bacterium]|jgi:ABC-type antimicrobial peptide transport system permease subunit|nr:ABC transporter permease [Prevotellaceae bacterium]